MGTGRHELPIHDQKLPGRRRVISIEQIRADQARWEEGMVNGPNVTVRYLGEGTLALHGTEPTLQDVIGPERYANYLERLGDISIDWGEEPSLVDRIRSFGHSVIKKFII